MKRLVLALSLLSFSGTAFAQDYEADPIIPQEEEVMVFNEGVETNYVRRGLTLPKMTLRGDASLAITGGSAINTDFVLSIGGSFGITDDLEVGISSWRMGTLRSPFGPPSGVLGSHSGLISLRFTNGFAYGDIPIWGRYRFLEGKFEVAAEVGFLIPTNTEFGFWLGVPVRIHISDKLTIDTGAHFALSFVGGTSLSDLRVPAELNFGLGDQLYVGLNTGLGVFDFSDIYIPLGAQFGYTLDLGNGNPLLDLEIEFNFPGFITTAGNDAINANFYLGLNARFYYGL